MHGIMPFKSRYSDLNKESNRKKKCYCLRGGLKLINCFGAWDRNGLDPPEHDYRMHVCSGHYLLDYCIRRRAPTAHYHSHRKALPSVIYPKANDMLSLSYLCRFPKEKTESEQQESDENKFHHFETAEEHIKFYRENNAYSLSNQHMKNTKLDYEPVYLSSIVQEPEGTQM